MSPAMRFLDSDDAESIILCSSAANRFSTRLKSSPLNRHTDNGDSTYQVVRSVSPHV